MKKPVFIISCLLFFVTAIFGDNQTIDSCKNLTGTWTGYFDDNSKLLDPPHTPTELIIQYNKGIFAGKIKMLNRFGGDTLAGPVLLLGVCKNNNLHFYSLPYYLDDMCGVDSRGSISRQTIKIDYVLETAMNELSGPLTLKKINNKYKQAGLKNPKTYHFPTKPSTCH